MAYMENKASTEAVVRTDRPQSFIKGEEKVKNSQLSKYRSRRSDMIEEQSPWKVKISEIERFEQREEFNSQKLVKLEKKV